MNRWLRALYKRLGILQVGRRRVRDLIDFIEDRKIDVVIDVGANIGQFGQLLRKQGFQGKIVSFEPTNSAFQTLQKRAAADGNWEVHHCGLGASAGESVIHVSQLSVCSSILPLTGVALLHDSRLAEDHNEKIVLRTLDQAASGLTGNILLKIDTQGYEKQVMEGAPSDDFIMRNAMDAQEVAVGWWPGDRRYGTAAFYAYAHPAPEGFAGATLSPASARWNATLGEYILNWADVCSSPDPHAAGTDFARSAFRHACLVCDWDPALPASAEGTPPPLA